MAAVVNMGLIRLQVQTLTGKIIPVTIEEAGATIKTVKEGISQAESIDVNYQCLICEGEICMNKENIKHYEIRDNSKLHLILPIRDGSFNPNHHMWGS